jgi:AcrR family transcriptional regulator
MTTLRQRAKETTRARLIEVSRAEFGRLGYGAVSLRDIARKAERSTGAVFCCFTDKAHLWREAMGCEPPDDTVRGSRALEFVRSLAHDGRRFDTVQSLSEAARAIVGEAA